MSQEYHSEITGEQIERVKRLISSQPSRVDREALRRLLIDHQNLKRETEILREKVNQLNTTIRKPTAFEIMLRRNTNMRKDMRRR